MKFGFPADILVPCKFMLFLSMAGLIGCCSSRPAMQCHAGTRWQAKPVPATSGMLAGKWLCEQPMAGGGLQSRLLELHANGLYSLRIVTSGKDGTSTTREYGQWEAGDSLLLMTGNKWSTDGTAAPAKMAGPHQCRAYKILLVNEYRFDGQDCETGEKFPARRVPGDFLLL